MIGWDTAQIVTREQAQKLGDLGYEFGCRYYRRSLNGKWTISQEEARDICDAGMFLVSVFQGDRETMKPGYYTPANGTIDAKAALAKARQMRQTRDTAIYFAVDTDIHAGNVKGVLEYFEAVEMEFRNQPWVVGVYGDDTVLDEVCDKNDLAAVGWLANAVGWRADKNYPHWEIKQISLPMQVMPGLMIDKNEAKGFSAAGMWVYA
jgi:hypothetical protein